MSRVLPFKIAIYNLKIYGRARGTEMPPLEPRGAHASRRVRGCCSGDAGGTSGVASAACSGEAIAMSSPPTRRGRAWFADARHTIAR